MRVFLTGSYPGPGADHKHPGDEFLGPPEFLRRYAGAVELHPPVDARYRLGVRLGAGAQAQVFRAVEIATGREVAVKALHPGIHATAPERFQREARALAALSHPHLVGFVALHPDHQPPLLVMEYVQGPSLETLLERGRTFPPGAATEIGRGLAGALAHMHEKGFLHRDLKPANVLIAEGRGPVLVDLGLALGDEDPKLTRTGAVVGTPAFLAPEMFRTLKASPATDVFALGVTLYQAMTRDLPYTFPEIADAGAGRPLPDRPVREMERLLGPVAAATLHPDPGRRPRAAALAEALRRGRDAPVSDLLPPEPIPGAVPSAASSYPGADSGRIALGPGPPRARRRLPGAGAMAAGLCLAGLGFWFPFVGAAPRLPPITLASTPFELEVTWPGEQGEEGLELCLDGAPVLTLGPGTGTRSSRVPLPRGMEAGLRRSGREQARPDPGDGPWPRMVHPAALPDPGGCRWEASPGGLALVVPADGWIPDRVQVRQTGGRRVVAPLREGALASYPLGTALDGGEILEVMAEARLEGGEFRLVRREPWATLDLRPRAERLVPDEGNPGTPDRHPGLHPGRVLPMTPIASQRYDPEAEPMSLLRVTAPFLAGARAGRLDGHRRWWLHAAPGGRAGLLGYATDPAVPPLMTTFPLPAVVPNEDSLAVLGGAVGVRFHDDQKGPARVETWFTVTPGNPGAQARLEPLRIEGFPVRSGPHPTGDGRAFFVSDDGRLRVSDASGRLGPPLGAGRPRLFTIRYGSPGEPGRHLALAGAWDSFRDRNHGILLIDAGVPRVLASVEGVPEPAPGHPLVIESGPARGVYLTVGADLFRLDLDHLAGPPASEVPAGDPPAPRHLPFGELVASGHAIRMAHARIADPKAGEVWSLRASGSARGEIGLLPFFDRDQGKAASGSGSQAGSDPGTGSGYRWRLRILGPGMDRILELDHGPFPMDRIGVHHAAVRLDPSSDLAVVTHDSAQDRWVVSLVSIARATVLVQWSIQVLGSIQPAVLTERGAELPLWPANLMVFPLPPLGLPVSRDGSSGSSPGSRVSEPSRPAHGEHALDLESP